MLIQSIIQNQESNFHYKWPPLKDQEIIQKIRLKANNLNSTQTVINKINSYFGQLKEDIIKKIDLALKKAINQALEMPFGKEQILQRYQEISQIKNFRSLLIQDQNKSFDLYQQFCKDFIQQIELQKDRNTQLLQELLHQCDKVQELANFDRLNQSKQFILDFLDTFNVFENRTEGQVNSSSHISRVQFQQQENSKLDKLMQLISNKTNYCSQEFLSEIRQQMQKLSFFFEQISFEKMNQDNKQAIKFSVLSDDKINNVNEYVEHLINMQNNIQYSQSVNNSNQIQNLQNNKMKYCGDYGISKFLKGDNKQLLDENSTLEFRVWLGGQQVEVLNYPNYSYQVQIQDQYKQNLLQNDMCLYFYLFGHQDKIILIEALTVEQF